MAKEQSLGLRICNGITRYSLYALIFLAPLFFLPWTLDVLDFNKQALLLTLVSTALFSWMLSVLISGKFEMNSSHMHIVLGIVFLVLALSTAFSVNRYGSFWGWPQVSSESLLTMMALVIFYFLLANTFSKKEIYTSVLIISCSAVVLELYGILQVLGLHIIPVGFANASSFNTVGSFGGLGFVAAVLLPVSIVLLIGSKKWWKILFAVQIALSALVFFLINYPIVWWSVIVGMALLMVFAVIKRDLFDGRWMALPMFFLALGMFFVLLNPQISLLARTNEIFLSQKTNFDIALKSLRERPIFGSGPGTFGYDFAKFKNPELNKTALWNTSFNRSTTKVLGELATGGILGFLALLAFLGFPIFLGVKYLLAKKEARGISEAEKTSNRLYLSLVLGILAALVAQAFTYFLYNSNIVLDIIYFMAIASLVALISEEKQKYELKPSSLMTLGVTFAFTLIFIFGLGLLILDGQRYIAEASYYKGLASWQRGNKDAGLTSMENAAKTNTSSDLYFRQLAQIYLVKLQDELQNNKNPTDDAEKQKVQAILANAINASKIATDLNPNNATNWSMRGYIYQNLLAFTSDASDWAIKSYDEALKLAPADSYLYAQEGNVYFGASLVLSQDKQDQKNKLLNQAKDKLEKAVTLNPNYSNALYSLGLVYDELGMSDKAMATFQALGQLNPKNTDIPKILENIKNGKPALQQPSAPKEAPPSEMPSTQDSAKSADQKTNTGKK